VVNDKVKDISFEAMLSLVTKSIRVTGTELTPIEKSRARILGEDVKAPGPVPAWDKSSMDGFAVRSLDVKRASEKNPAPLTVVVTIPAGQYSDVKLEPGQAARIMTGAPLPAGADCVVRVEDTSEDGEQVEINAAANLGLNVIKAGSEMRKGQTVLRRGTVIGPAQMAMLALLDRPSVKVHKQPRVGVLTTGDELGEVGKKRRAGQIPDSNRYGLLGLVESAGCIPIDAGTCGDEPESLRRALTKFAPRCDFILSSGGVSAGDFDVVKVLFRKIGGVGLYRLPMKPGKPQAFGRVKGVPYFGLPGNPVSCLMVFEVILRRVLRRMAGVAALEVNGRPATATIDFPKKSRAWEFPRVHAVLAGNEWRVTPVRSQRSADLTSMTDATGYLLLGPKVKEVKSGGRVWYIPFAT
jgi:molybdopterin molybdotransferase